tara:strand:+ start:190 stop:390 length:201 start_codon:yes stop_codon:yes gene_type:complete
LTSDASQLIIRDSPAQFSNKFFKHFLTSLKLAGNNNSLTLEKKPQEKIKQKRLPKEISTAEVLIFT